MTGQSDTRPRKSGCPYLEVAPDRSPGGSGAGAFVAAHLPSGRILGGFGAGDHLSRQIVEFAINHASVAELDWSDPDPDHYRARHRLYGRVWVDAVLAAEAHLLANEQPANPDGTSQVLVPSQRPRRRGEVST